jgi:KRAB domain-containing zinc finger protein
MRIHAGVKPFACDFCDKRFRQSSGLKEHRRIHTGEKPYACDFCQRRCTTKSNLNSHIRNIHGSS